MTSVSRDSSSVAAAFFSPAIDLIADCSHTRSCPALPDATWIRLGIDRVLQEIPSGRAYLQQHGYRFDGGPLRSSYFESLGAKRRLRLVSELNDRLIQSITPALGDPLAQYPELADFDLYAGDGHWHGAAAHDAPIDGAKRAVGHFYALDLRRHTLRHLDLAQGKKEHDMHLLKRQTADVLRQGAAKGRKVLYVWDKAGIDFRAWHRWKHSSGVYFVSLEKSNMDQEIVGQPDWDRADPVNAGIQSVEWVAGCAGVMVRRIRYVEPVTGETLTFLTTEMELSPGLIGFLYKLRWNIEKVYDQLKNKLSEVQAWASSREAKIVQAQFISLTHNLLVLLEGRLAAEGIENTAEMARRARVLSQAMASAAQAGRKLPSPVETLQRLTQRSVKLLRWLRSSLLDRLAWHTATPRLRALYAQL